MSYKPRQLPKLSRWANEIELTPLQSALAAASSPDVLSLAMGLPDPKFFPTSQLARAATRMLASNASTLQYGLPCLPLKERICEYMMHRGVECTPECVMLTQGAQQALYLLARLLLDPGSLVIEEEVSYPGFQSLIDAFRPEILTISSSTVEGIDVEAVENILTGGARPAFIYVMPTAHNPLGISLSTEKRMRLAHLAREFQVPLIEDDPYGALFYGDASIPPIKAVERDWVYYVGSFSKVLGPSLRVGWIVAPEEHIRALSILKEGTDLNVSTLSQWIANEYLQTEQISLHLTDLRTAYGIRHNAMAAALSRFMPSAARWHIPACGVFFWVELPEFVDTSKLLMHCLREENVAFLPSEACSRGKHRSGIRLNFSRWDTDQIADGVARIGKVLGKMDQASEFCVHHA
jgi:2-aminoadipate transaminase